MQTIYLIKIIYLINSMDKTIYIYLAILVVLYGIYRLNTNEHFSENTTVYVKSKYNLDRVTQQELDELKKIEIKKNQIKQFDEAKEQIVKAQNREIQFKQNIVNAQLEESKSREEELEIQLKLAQMDKYEKDMQIANSEHEILRLSQLAYEQKLREEQLVEEQKLREEQYEQEQQNQIQKMREDEEFQESQKIQLEEIRENEKLQEIQIQKARQQEEELKRYNSQKKDYIHKLNDKIVTNINTTSKTYTEQFKQITNKVYEYMSGMNTPSSILPKIFNTAKTCGFSYKLVTGSTAPVLTQGQMYISEDKTTLLLHYADLAGLTGINIPLSGSSLLITDGIKKYYIGISNFNSNVNNTGIFSLKVNLSGIPDGFFNSISTFILFECDDNEIPGFIMENQLWNSLLVFLGLVLLTLIVIHYKTVLDILIYLKNSMFGSSAQSGNKNIEGGQNIFYIGGYDYRDYSD